MYSLKYLLSFVQSVYYSLEILNYLFILSISFLKRGPVHKPKKYIIQLMAFRTKHIISFPPAKVNFLIKYCEILPFYSPEIHPEQLVKNII